MKEAVILQSPHAIDPMKNLTEAEKVERYRTRLDETFRPYTVVDVLTGVYHRCFEDDLRNYIGENPDEFVSLEEGWCVSRAWVNECRVGRVETLFFQPLSDFQVELFVHAALRVEIVRNGNALLKRTKSICCQSCLPNCAGFRPLHLLRGSFLPERYPLCEIRSHGLSSSECVSLYPQSAQRKTALPLPFQD